MAKQVEFLSDDERMLVITLLMMRWVEIRGDRAMEAQTTEVVEIIRKLNGVDKNVNITVRCN